MSEACLEAALRIRAIIGQGVPVGRGPEGERIDYPILGGEFQGSGIAGSVPPGGADHYLERADGLGVLDARYHLRCEDGSRIAIHNRGLLRLTARGTELARGQWPIDPAEYCCRCTTSFATEAPHLSWLQQHVFVSAVYYPGLYEVAIDVYKLI
ncbi:DUF3237 domain-containing protein [Pseudomonas sp. RIT-PI-S]|uniref:DUF3237 domain-containing protein n=1 Tax=Pseudomonas sp. RIT-PI-S TaxID=3035295 RepID=UPI0021D9AC95|nr:DUF3237 domain-containing protein [Pseudomonas sp. RIT-PI-S]